ncbi:MAG: hypothetical protein FWD31_12025 [Planctomycetaceae bacterium]|nr:hypothetical protein [Planctomycetaceae bacterium]
MKSVLRFLLFTMMFGAVVFAQAQSGIQANTPGDTVSIKIDASQKGEAISPLIYGQFIEHLGRCIDGGIWAEMLGDRKFYYPVGDKESSWYAIYDCKMNMNTDAPFVGDHTPESIADAEARWLGVAQKHLVIQKDRKYKGYAWVKLTEGIEKVEVHFHWSTVHDDFTQFQFPVKVGEYYKIDFEFTSPVDFENLELEIAAFGKGSFFVGTVSLMPADNIHGMRADTMQLLKELNAPIYRWPGGNFVSGYDWRDGIGERDLRPPRKNPAWLGVEHNDFGLDEFMVFCKELGTEPYIAVNTGAGEVENALAELQYANGRADTEMGQLRAKNGHAEPYNVQYWGIGNEMYGDWQIGHMPTEQYAEKHNRFVDTFRQFDPDIKVIAVGAVGKWDEVIMRQCADHMDLISEHFYVQQRENVVEHIALVTNAVKWIADAHRKYREDFPELKGKDIRIALDEWNYWYGPHVFGELGTRYFMKDGLGIAAGLHEFFRNSDIFFMANYAQTVNVIGCIKTNKTDAQFETTGLALKLYRNQFGTIPLKVEFAKPFDVAAALTEDGKVLTLAIVNPTDKAADFSLETTGLPLETRAQKFEIANDDPMAHNDPGAKRKIDIEESQIALTGGHIAVAPMSITVLRIAIPMPILIP